MALQLSAQEKENRRTALIITSVLYAALFIFCFVWIVMTIPDPLPSEIAEGGVEVSYGFDDQGSGDVESLAPPNTNPPNPEARAGNPPADEQPRPQAAPPTPAPAPAPKPDDDEALVTTDDPDSPEEVKTRPEPKKEEPKKEPKPETPVRKPVETPPRPVEKPTPPAPKVEEKPKPQVDRRALFTKTDKPGAGGTGTGTSDRTAGNNNGDDAGKVGDKGDPRGIMGSKNYSGTPGTGGGDAGGVGTGVNSNITGWNARIGRPGGEELEGDGYVEFKVTIDEDGRVVEVIRTGGTLSPADAAICKRYVQRGTYTPKDGNDGGGVGTVRFVIKAR